VDVDRASVEAAQAGDDDAIDALIRRYQVRIFNFARTLTANDSDAEDLAQETFARAFRSLSRFRGESSFKNWLYQIATNVGRTHFSRRARQAPVWERRVEADDIPESLVASRAPNVEDTAMRRQALVKALSTLSRDLRLPLVLHDVEGLEYQEIAAVLEVPIGTVMSRIFRARRRLRPLLADLVVRRHERREERSPRVAGAPPRLGKVTL